MIVATSLRLRREVDVRRLGDGHEDGAVCRHVRYVVSVFDFRVIL